MKKWTLALLLTLPLTAQAHDPKSYNTTANLIEENFLHKATLTNVICYIDALERNQGADLKLIKAAISENFKKINLTPYEVDNYLTVKHLVIKTMIEENLERGQDFYGGLAGQRKRFDCFNVLRLLKK
jgi:hypothetical protein